MLKVTATHDSHRLAETSARTEAALRSALWGLNLRSGESVGDAAGVPHVRSEGVPHVELESVRDMRLLIA